MAASEGLTPSSEDALLGPATIDGQHTSWAGKSIVSVQQFTREALELFFKRSKEMRTAVTQRGGLDVLQRRILANIFYEPSTRTSCSFAAAMQRLGGTVLQINESSSSAKKGETLEDTIRCLECYADFLVLRHPQTGAARQAAVAAGKPVINAGDGTGEHPTQALLDIFTIFSELQHLDGLTVTMLGDLKHGRTVHSLARLLRFFNVTLQYVAPASLAMPTEIVDELEQEGVQQTQHSELTTDLVASTDVLYVTRIQKERFETLEQYETVKGMYVVTRDTLHLAKPEMIVMHPLPRVDEISTDVDKDPRAAYFRQMQNGLYARMALLTLIADVSPSAIAESV